MTQQHTTENLILRLPAELREQIYLNAFATDRPTIIDYSVNRLDLRVIGDIVILTPSVSRKNGRRGEHAIALLRTCKAIHHEALPSLYASLRFVLRLGSPPGRFFYHDVIKDLNLGLIGDCLLLRHARHLNMTVELQSIDHMDYLLQTQLPRVSTALREGQRPDIRYMYVAISLPIPEERDHEVLDALQNLFGGDFENLRRHARHAVRTRRFHKINSSDPSTSVSSSMFAAAQTPGN